MQDTPQPTNTTPTDLAADTSAADLNRFIREWQPNLEMADVHDLEELLDDGVALLRKLLAMHEAADHGATEIGTILAEAQTFLKQFE